MLSRGCGYISLLSLRMGGGAIVPLHVLFPVKRSMAGEWNIQMVCLYIGALIKAININCSPCGTILCFHIATVMTR